MVRTTRLALVAAPLLVTMSMATAVALRETEHLRHPGSTAYADLLVAGAAWALVACAGWAVLACAAALLEIGSGGRVPLTTWVGCPAPARRALLAALGVALAGGGAAVAAPVSAAPAPLGPPHAGPTGPGRVDLPVPARPTGASYAVPRQRVEVRPGDNLWRLSRQQASATASTQELARLVERTYRANRRVIGPDPDVIHPGQRLRIPHQRPHTPPHLETP